MRRIWIWLPGAVGIAALVAWAVLVAHEPRRALAAYAAAWVACTAIAMGALGLDLLFVLCGAIWHISLRRPLQALHGTLTLLLVLFLPLAWGAGSCYPWAPAVAADDPHVQGLLRDRHGWNSLSGFVIRSLVVLAVLVVISVVLRIQRQSQERQPSAALVARERRWAAWLIVPYAIAATIGALDWGMTSDAQMASTVYAPMLWSIGTAGAVAVWTLAVQSRSANQVVTVQHLIALGRLQLCFLSFSMYLVFCQLLITYMGDLPQESAWYIIRLHRPYVAEAFALAFAGYLLPWWLLLSQALKRHARWLATLSAVLLGARIVDYHWLLLPGLAPHGPAWCWADAFALVGCAGLVVAVMASQLARWRRLPLDDWRMPASLHYEARVA